MMHCIYPNFESYLLPTGICTITLSIMLLCRAEKMPGWVGMWMHQKSTVLFSHAWIPYPILM